MTEQELKNKIEALGDITDEQRNSIVCSLIGHSKIIEIGFGYVYCGRCGQQIGDKLGGVFDDSKHVVIGHNCETCRENYENLTWEDLIYSRNPFPFKFDREYRGDLSLEGVVEHFTDDICEKLDCGLIDSEVKEANNVEGYCKEILTMGNGLKIETDIYSGNNEWICHCREVS